MKSRELFRLSLFCLAALAAVSAAACSQKAETTPPVATPSLTLSHDRAPAGSPLELTYKFVVANDAHLTEDYRVFVHVVDTDEEQMWTDDHNPPVPTSQWKPGQTVEYSRTIFVPVFPYVGDATVQMGLHSTKDQKRLTLGGEDVGQHAYKVAKLQLLPQTDNLFTVFKDGWNPAEAAAQDSAVEWQWTKKQATLAFKNPKKDAVLYFDADSPQPDLHPAQHVQISLGGQVLEDYTLTPEKRELRKIKLPGSLMGAADLSELQITVDPTFVPMTVTNGTSKDPRELGIRVFHAYVDPR
jgi:hypothetical protein